MSRQLPADAHVALSRLEAVDGADVVQAAAGHEAPRGGVRAGHHPGGTQGDGVHLVRAVAVPHDQLAVLGRRHKVPMKGQR